MTRNTIMKTPRGKALWSHLVTPQTFKGAPATAENPGKYEVDLVLDPDQPEVANFFAELDEWCQNEITTLHGADPHPKQYLPIVPEVRKTDDGHVETGHKVLKFRLRAGGVYPRSGDVWTETPSLFDHTGTPMESLEQELGNGSIIRVSFEPNMYAKEGLARVSFKLRCVQIVSAKYYEARDTGPKNDFDGDEQEPESFDF